MGRYWLVYRCGISFQQSNKLDIVVGFKKIVLAILVELDIVSFEAQGTDKRIFRNLP